MGATGFATVAIKNTLLSTFATSAPYLTLLRALTLQAATTIGAATFSVDLSVQAGDLLYIDFGNAGAEAVTVASVTGTGPYTVTGTGPLTKAHLVNVPISHVPLSSTTVHEVAITRVAASWGTPTGGVLTAAPGQITSIPSGTVVGSLAAFSASTAGNYIDSTPIPAQTYPSGGAGTPAWVETLT